jgi:hypothetical protein
VSFIERSVHPDMPRSNRGVIAQFLTYGFAGAIKAWFGDPSVAKNDLIDASTACAPVWWIQLRSPFGRVDGYQRGS